MIKNVPPPKPSKLSQRAKEANRKSLSRAKKSKAKAEQKIKQLENTDKVLKGKSVLISEEDTTELPPRVTEVIDEEVYAFRANPGPQTLFLSAVEQEVLYGGAAGGGKSYGMLADPLRYCGISDHRGLLLRRTTEELRELIFKSKQLYPLAYPGAKWQEKGSTWTFPSGATQWVTYLDRDDDVTRYQGQAFNWIGFDELTHWPSPYPWDYLRSRLRTTNPNLPLYQRATTNPGGVGSSWVRAMFIDPAPWGEAFPARDLESDEVIRYPTFDRLTGEPHPRAGEVVFYRRFIPANLMDNPYLYADGKYEANLMSLPESQRRRLLEGDWDVVDGAAFPEFRRGLHTCVPFEIPHGWVRFRACDWGYRSPACVLWFTVDWDGVLYVYRELYVKGMTADTFARMILDIEYEAGENIRYGILDASTWAERGDTGPSIAETMIQEGCRWRPSDRRKNSRINGKLEVHKRLQLQGTGRFEDNEEDKIREIKKPKLIVFNTCNNLIRTLPTLPLDKNNTEDVDTDAEDHAYDALRYGCASRPIKPSGGSFDSGLRVAGSSNKFIPADSVVGY